MVGTERMFEKCDYFLCFFMFLSIAFSIKSFHALSDNSNFLWITYFALAGAEAFFYCIAEELKKKKPNSSLKS